MPRIDANVPPQPVRAFAKALTWLIITLPQLPDKLRRKIVEWGCEHEFKIEWWSKGVGRVYYIEQCRRCEKTLPINNIDRHVWEQMQMDICVKKQKYLPPFLRNA